MVASNRCSSAFVEAGSFAERFPVGVDAGLPFRACFLADMANYLLHLSQPAANFAFPLAGGGVMGLSGNPPEVPFDLRDKLVQALQGTSAADAHFSSPS